MRPWSLCRYSQRNDWDKFLKQMESDWVQVNINRHYRRPNPNTPMFTGSGTSTLRLPSSLRNRSGRNAYGLGYTFSSCSMALSFSWTLGYSYESVLNYPHTIHSQQWQSLSGYNIPGRNHRLPLSVVNLFNLTRLVIPLIPLSEHTERCNRLPSEQLLHQCLNVRHVLEVRMLW